MRISDWSSDVCSSDLDRGAVALCKAVLLQPLRDSVGQLIQFGPAQPPQRIGSRYGIRAFRGVGTDKVGQGGEVAVKHFDTGRAYRLAQPKGGAMPVGRRGDRMLR